MALKNNGGNTSMTAKARSKDFTLKAAGSEILIDTSSGISVEEQQEILVQINGIAEKNRQSLSVGGTETGGNLKKRFTAKKNGGLFPVLVNLFALAVLAGGFFALYSFQREANIQAREGTRVFSDIERALIEEIRRETSALLAAKDHEINTILNSLGDVETQLHELLVGSEVLTLEQQAIQGQLILQQEQGLAALAQAREERSQILEEARSREAVLQAQLDARSRELAAIAARHSAELDATRAELAQVSREQAQAATVEAQIAAFFANIHTQVAENRFNDAEQTIGSLREFINSPAFHGIRAIQARRDLYTQATDTLETLLEEHRIAHEAMIAGALPPDRDAEMRLQGDVSRLEDELAAAREAIVAGDAGAALHIAQLQSSITSLQSTNTTLSSQNQTLTSQNTTLASQNATLTTQVGTLQGNLTAQTQAAETLRQEAAAHQTQIASLNQTVGARDNTIRELEEQSTSQEQTIANLNTQLTQIREALQALSQ
ncbi:MAG: hypothetical protein FWB78_02655 [Treponema sp.]|nr:hypothetical protein [Treponema sp.]